MQANELRIGNLVVDGLTGAYLKVSGLDDEGHITTTVIDRSKFPLPDGWNIQPIPLTPEILEKAGFPGDYYAGEDYIAGKGGYTILLAHKLFRIDGRNAAKVEQLHQLQNLYFSLTWEELEINL